MRAGFVLCSLVGLIAPAQAHFVSVEELARFCSAKNLSDTVAGYVAGVMDELSMRDPPYCAPTDATPAKAAAAVCALARKDAAQFPKIPANLEVRAALIQAWPCPKQ